MNPWKLLRWLVSGLLLALVLSSAGLPQLLSAASRLRPAWGLASLGIFFLAHVTMARVLQQILLGLGRRIPYGGVFRRHLEGLFVGSALPGMMGGDVYRALLVGRLAGDSVLATGAVALQRVLSLVVAMALVALTAPLAARQLITGPSLWELLIGAALLLLVGGLGWWLLVRQAPRRPWGRRLVQRLREVQGAFRELLGRPAILSQVVLLQLATLLLNVSGVFALAKGLGLGLGWLPFLSLVPLSYMAVSLPISIGGLGVREGIYALLLAPRGVARPDAVALALLVFAAAVVLALIGALVFMAGGGRRGAEP